jgi:hypothetical protein
MKLAPFALLLPYLLATPAAATCGPTINLGKTCDLAALTAAISGTTCTLELLFPGQDAATIEDTVTGLCEYDAPVQFMEIQGTYQRDHRYMDGGGDHEDGEYDFDMSTARINRFIKNDMGNSLISWPEYEQKEDYNRENGYGVNGYMTNFNIDRDAEKGSCHKNTAMCCFINSAKDALVDNTDVCRHDLANSRQSNHVNSGWSVFTEDEPAHCVGFTWKDGEESDTYKGNALLYASMWQTATKGYMGNVPGAPMCACVEQMPVVTEAACVTASGTGLNYQFIVDQDTGEVSATHSVTMSYEDCGDLKTHVQTVHSGSSIAEDIGENLVGPGNCDVENADYLNDEQLLVASDSSIARFANLDGTVEYDIEWKQLFGEGIFFLPAHADAERADTEMRTAMEACIPSKGRHCMILRKCTSCTVDSHKTIVYQRKTELPPFAAGPSTAETMDIPELFMNKWRKPNNVMHTDYELYSSVAEALAGEGEWQQSDYNSNNNNYGFPRNSGPVAYVGNQWNSYKWGGGHANQHAFYVEVPSDAASA